MYRPLGIALSWHPGGRLRYIDPKTWVLVWKEAGPRLEAIRRDELRSIDVPAVIHSFNDAFAAALGAVPPSRTSGLVEQQRLFARLRL